MSRRIPLALVVLAAAITLLVASGLAGGASTAGEPRKGGTLRMVVAADVDSLDPALAYYPTSWVLGYATCAKLFNYPDRPGVAGARLVPEVVDRYAVSKDGRTYTFDLKRSFRFHTGAPVTARSFADALDRDASPKLESPATTYMREIVGAAEVIDGKAKSITGVRALGRYRLQIRLKRPVGDFTARLTMPFFCPVAAGTPPTETDEPAGSGPYYVAERIVNQRIVLKRNPYYRGTRPANVDQVVWTIGSPDACLEVEQDRVDYCQYLLSAALTRRLADKYGVNRPDGRFFVSGGLETRFIAFNHARPAFRGPGQIPLKQAINYALDRRDLASRYGYLAGKPTDQLLPPVLALPARIYPLGGPDLARATTLLEQARVRPNRLVLYADNSSIAVAVIQTLVSNLKQLGIEVEPKYFDFLNLFERVKAPGEPFDLVLGGWIADYADAASFFVPLLSHGGAVTGVVKLDDPHINRQIDAANRLTGEARRRAWADLDADLMRDNPPWAPIVHSQEPIFVSQSLGCFLAHPVYGFDIAAVCKK